MSEEEPRSLVDADCDDDEITSGRRPRVLVADDDADVRRLVSIAMRNDGYEVVEAIDGARALAILVAAMVKDTPARSPDIIITDVQMPGMNGLSLLSELRACGWFTPVIVMTAYGTEHVRALAETNGADALFYKPFEMKALRNTVMNLLRPTHLPRRFTTMIPND